MCIVLANVLLPPAPPLFFRINTNSKNIVTSSRITILVWLIIIYFIMVDVRRITDQVSSIFRECLEKVDSQNWFLLTLWLFFQQLVHFSFYPLSIFLFLFSSLFNVFSCLIFNLVRIYL